MSCGKIQKREFKTAEDLVRAVANLLEERFTRSFGRPHAVMLSGGRTPLPAYGEVKNRRLHGAEDLYVLFSDERMVPPDSPESNYGNVRCMLNSAGIADERVIRVQTGLPVKAAAAQYDKALQQFVKCGGRITLGLLGLGADGHTASLFSSDQIQGASGAYAMAVPRKEGPSRVSVTPGLLKRVEAIIFLAVGREKREIVSRLLVEPDQVPAGLAVREAPAVQVWVA